MKFKNYTKVNKLKSRFGLLGTSYVSVIILSHEILKIKLQIDKNKYYQLIHLITMTIRIGIKILIN